MDLDDACIHCTHCTIDRPGRKRKASCEPPKTKVWPGLIPMLRELFDVEVWRELRGRMKPGTYKRPEVGRKKHLPPAAWDFPLREAKSETEQVAFLDSEPPRIVTQTVLGPNVMARNFFPDVLEAPDCSDITPEEAIRLELEYRRKQLKRRFSK